MIKKLSLLIFIITFVIELHAQVAAPGLIQFGVQDNPATIYWKNKNSYIGYVYFENTRNYKDLQNFANNTTQNSTTNEFSFGSKTDGLAFELRHRESKIKQKNIITAIFNDTKHYIDAPMEGDAAETTYQGALGSDIVSFGYTSVSKGSMEVKWITNTFIEDAVSYNEDYADFEINVEVTQTSKNLNSTYGFTFKVGDIYLGYAFNIESVEDFIQTTKTSQRFLYNGSCISGYCENKTEISKKENILKKKYYYGIAYQFNKYGGNALHIEANRIVRPEKFVKARNSDYKSSEVTPYHRDLYKFEYRFDNGFYIGLWNETEFSKTSSWESVQSETKGYKQQLITGIQGDTLQLIIAFYNTNEAAILSKTNSSMKALGLSFVF